MAVKTLYQGSTPLFLKRMAAFAEALPDLYRRVDHLELQPSYTGLKGVKFVEGPVTGDKFLYDRSKDEVIIYPTSFRSGDRIDAVLYAAFGRRHWLLNVSNEDRIRWVRMYAFPSRSLIDRILELLTGKITFADILSQFKTANDKAVTIHILNALTKNAITPSSLPSVNVRNHPCISDFINGRRAYSLQPLMSAYGGGLKRVAHYEDAFAEYCLGNGSFQISESSTKEAYTRLFKEVSSV